MIAGKEICVVTAGSYGNAAGRYLRAFFPGCVEDGGACLQINPASDIRVIAVAAWRPVPALCERAEQISYARRIPFIPLIQDGRRLQVGPVVIPGNGACWSCGMLRFLQHEISYSRRKAIMEHYRANQGSGPKGYLEPFALIGAARLAETIKLVDSGEMPGGRIWELDMLSRRASLSTVTGVDGCVRCGTQPPAGTRGHVALAKALDYLWQTAWSADTEPPDERSA